ncbi:MAG: hypothetical protein HYV63_17505 [Candidatus Schekmanbacteria bacterium]|nr:hypothetical protein [Candidatus Schekmanbacteria bacterium]
MGARRHRIVFVVNEVMEIAATQTTAMLMRSAAAAGHPVLVAGVLDLSARGDGLVSVTASDVDGACAGTCAELVAALGAASRHRRIELSSRDIVMLRTNPARDRARAWAHELLLGFARLAQERGTCVINDPDGLARSSSKLFLLSLLPRELAPASLVTRSAADVAAFAAAVGGAVVVKPARGTRGRNVQLLRAPDIAPARAALAPIAVDDYALVQEYLPQAVDGDVRVVVLDGAVLEVAGRVAAIRRIPAPGDFRSNLHAGGTAAPATVSGAMRQAANAIAQKLQNEGVYLAGIDFVGEKVVEVNTFSTGGLRDAERFCGVDFCSGIIAAAVRRAEEVRSRCKV